MKWDPEDCENKQLELGGTHHTKRWTGGPVLFGKIHGQGSRPRKLDSYNLYGWRVLK